MLKRPGEATAADRMIVDAQVHFWSAARVLTPENAHHVQCDSFTDTDFLPKMNAAGVDAAMIVPVWSADDSAALSTVHRHAERLALFGRIYLQHRNLRTLPPRSDGFSGIRVAFPEHEPGPEPSDDWIWAAAARDDLPIMVWAPKRLREIGFIATRYPQTRFIIDHLGCRRQGLGKDAFEHLPDLVDLARLGNVAVKATALPCYSRDLYPFADLHDPLWRAFDAFGPERLFWGSDLTRLPVPYARAISLFTEELPWLAGRDLDLVMGEAICHWIGWWPASTARPTT